MIRKIPPIFIIFFSLVSLHSFGQIGWDSSAIRSKNRFFVGVTYNLLPGIEKGPANIYPNYVTDNLLSPPYPRQGFSAVFLFNTDFATIGGKIRYNVIQFSPRTSVSLSTSPSFGIGLTVVDEEDIHQITPYADASYNIPFFLEFNYGNGATHNNYDTYGLFVFGGVEFTGLLLQNSMANGALMDAYGNFYTADFINHWAEPALGLGVRYKNRRNVEREIFFKYGVGPTKLYLSPYDEVQSARAWTLKLSFVRNF